MTPCINEVLKLHSQQLEAALGLDVGSARIEAQCLLQAALQVNRAWLLTHPERILDAEEHAHYTALIGRRLRGEPIAYILGSREFYGLDFKVTPATLIPRPETELLVEQALLRVPQQGGYRVLDLGTGSGAIALSIAHARPNAEVVAVDASQETLEVAQENTQRLNTGNVRLLRSDWFAALQGECFDLIVSNPPYVATDDAHLAQGDLRFEPRSALASGTDGLDDIRRIVAQAQAHLNPGGCLLFEHGYDQAAPVRALLRQAGFAEVFSMCDLSGIERVSGGTWSPVHNEVHLTTNCSSGGMSSKPLPTSPFQGRSGFGAPPDKGESLRGGIEGVLTPDSAIDKPSDFAGTPPISDTLQRPLRDLRISVTDRCNLRCTYCMPSAVFDRHHVFLPRAELLSFEEIARLAQSFVRLGVQKIRLTGGEPLLRRGIEQLVERLAGLRTAQGRPVEIAMTTNGVLLAGKAQALKDAGLSRITVSLDGLSDQTFLRMSDSDVPVQTVLDGIAAAQRAGFAPIKINMVVQRGVNDHEIIAMAEHFRNRNIVLRFIEYMDVGSSNGWQLDEVVTARQILEQIAGRYPIQPIDPDYPGEVAERWRYADGGGEIGVIAAITQAFCHSCTRARISTDGKLYTCLFATNGLDLRAPLRQGAPEQALTKLISDHWQQRKDRYSQLRQTTAGAASAAKIEMSYIGG